MDGMTTAITTTTVDDHPAGDNVLNELPATPVPLKMRPASTNAPHVMTVLD